MSSSKIESLKSNKNNNHTNELIISKFCECPRCHKAKITNKFKFKSSQSEQRLCSACRAR